MLPDIETNPSRWRSDIFCCQNSFSSLPAAPGIMVASLEN
jgi:hypothetical protein